MMEFILFLIFIFVVASIASSKDTKEYKEYNKKYELDKTAELFNKEIGGQNLYSSQNAHSETSNTSYYNNLTPNQKRIKDFLEKRNITTLIHFTSGKNLESIIKNGLLSVDKLNERGINYNHNDSKRYDKRTDCICLSITKPNKPFLRDLIKKNKIEPYIIEIDASILWKEEKNFRIYCQTNAATKSGKKGESFEDLQAMFDDNVSYTAQGEFREFNRYQLQLYETTAPQAEILWKDEVQTKYFIKYYPYKG